MKYIETVAWQDGHGSESLLKLLVLDFLFWKDVVRLLWKDSTSRNDVQRNFTAFWFRLFKAARVACLPEQQHGLSLVGVRVLRTLRVWEPKHVMLGIVWCHSSGFWQILGIPLHTFVSFLILTDSHSTNFTCRQVKENEETTKRWKKKVKKGERKGEKRNLGTARNMQAYHTGANGLQTNASFCSWLSSTFPFISLAFRFTFFIQLLFHLSSTFGFIFFSPWQCKKRWMGKPEKGKKKERKRKDKGKNEERRLLTQRSTPLTCLSSLHPRAPPPSPAWLPLPSLRLETW